jgi:hypothetical protein
MTNTSVGRNFLQFGQLEENITKCTLNSSLFALEMSAFKAKLSNEILDREVFAKLTSLSLSDFVDSIQTETFKSFKNLGRLFLTLFSLEMFFHNNRIDWMDFLNTRVKFDFESNHSDSNYFVSLYTFPTKT